MPGAAAPPGEARPGWKVLRVLGNLLGVAGFDYASSEEVRDELKRELGGIQRATCPAPTRYRAGHINGVDTVREVGIYDVDAIVRRSRPLAGNASRRSGSDWRERGGRTQCRTIG